MILGGTAVVVCVHDERQGTKNCAVLRELAVLSDDKETSLLRVNKHYEGAIAAHPVADLWLHSCGKTRPQDEHGLDPRFRI